jgi:hypothetical protein
VQEQSVPCCTGQEIASAAAVLGQVVEAEKRVGSRRNQEFEATVNDLKILANLALYHSRRIPAAVNYGLFERTGVPKARDEISAQVRAPTGVEWVRLRYRSVNQHDDYRTRPVLPTGDQDVHRAVIPPEHVVPTWDLMYLIEVVDNRGHGRIYPDLNTETPYVVVRLVR